MPRFEDLPKKTFKPKRRNSWDLSSLLNSDEKAQAQAISEQSETETSEIQTAEKQTAYGEQVDEHASPASNQAKQSEIQTTEKQTAGDAHTEKSTKALGQVEQSEIQTAENQTTSLDRAGGSAAKSAGQVWQSEIQTAEKQTTDQGRAEKHTRLASGRVKQSEIQTTEKQTAGDAHTEKSTKALGQVKQSEIQTAENQTTSPVHVLEHASTNSGGTERSEIQTSDTELGLQYGGFFPLCCEIFEPQLFHDLKPGELKLLLYLLFLSWRYPERPGHVRAALPYLERGTGITRSAVHDHMKSLIERGYIRCHEKNNKIGNLYFVSNSLVWKTEKQTAEKQTAGFQTAAVRNSDGSSLKNGLESSEKQTEELDLLDPLDLSTLDAEVGKYLAAIKATKKRESEREAFELLKRELSTKELLTAFRFVREKGTLTGERCHSPFSYLAQTVDQVLAVVMPPAPAASNDTRSSVSTTPEEGAVFERLKEEAWPCFVETYPNESDQKAVIDKINQERARLANGFLEPPHIARHMAVVNWYENQKTAPSSTSEPAPLEEQSVN